MTLPEHLRSNIDRSIRNSTTYRGKLDISFGCPVATGPCFFFILLHHSSFCFYKQVLLSPLVWSIRGAKRSLFFRGFTSRFLSVYICHSATYGRSSCSIFTQTKPPGLTSPYIDTLHFLHLFNTYPSVHELRSPWFFFFSSSPFDVRLYLFIFYFFFFFSGLFHFTIPRYPIFFACIYQPESFDGLQSTLPDFFFVCLYFMCI